MRREINTKFSSKKTLKEIDKLKDLILDGKIILKCFQYNRVKICEKCIFIFNSISGEFL